MQPFISARSLEFARQPSLAQVLLCRLKKGKPKFSGATTEEILLPPAV